MTRVFIISFLLLSQLSFGQYKKKHVDKCIPEIPENPNLKLSMQILDGDTFYCHMMRPFYAMDKKPYGNKRMDKKYRYLKYHVKKVYPYAKVAGVKLHEYNDRLMKMGSDVKRRKYMKLMEKELKAEFEGDMRNLSVYQGKILIRLIDRETGDTSYGLIKELRGSFQAFFWQSLARLFGSNLKMEYDPDSNEEDRIIEDIVMGIEAGYI